MVKKSGKKKILKKIKRKDNKISNINLYKKDKNKKNEINKKIEIKNNDEKEDNMCIICLANYDNSFHIKRKLKCKHSLCEDCFNKWYKIKESCPICRKNLFTNPSDHPDFASTVKDLYLHHDTYFSRDY